jgi:nucleoside 2-deoxyribosyltransferase
MVRPEGLRPLLYFAAPLFSEAELAYNEEVTSVLERHVDVYLPQRDGGKVVDLVAKGVEQGAAFRSIYDRDIRALKEADALFLLLDGRTIDEGAAFELGYAVALGKHCVGLQTDPRRLMPLGNNPMIQVPLNCILTSKAQVERWARDFARSDRLLPSAPIHSPS